MDLDDDLGFEPPDDYEPIELAGAPEANRMLRRLRAAEADAASVRQVAAEDMAQTAAWRDRRLESIDRTIGWARASLEGWLRATHEAGGPQTVKLPAGQVQLRKAGPRIEVLDAALEADVAEVWEMLAAEAGTPSPVNVRRTLSKTIVGQIVAAGPEVGPADPDGYEPRAAVLGDGTVVPGVIIHVPTRQGFTAKPATSIEDLEAAVDGEELAGAS